MKDLKNMTPEELYNALGSGETPEGDDYVNWDIAREFLRRAKMLEETENKD